VRVGYRDDVRALARRHLFDAVIALAAAGAIVEFAVAPNDVDYSATSSLWFLVPASLVTIGVLLVRRRFPFGAPVAVLVLVAAVSFVEGNFAPGSFAVFLATITSALLLGMAPERRQALAGIPIFVAAIAIAIRNQPTDGVEDFFFVTLILTCAWAAGFAIKSKLAEADARRVQAEELARTAAEEERGRIARELHDVVAHSVSVMTVQASAVRRRLAPEQAREREALLTVEETGRQALTEMRRLLGVLRQEGESAALAPQPGLETLDDLVQQVREAGLPVELSFEGDRVALPPGVDLSAFRIVQEALTNALRHAGPARAGVSVRYGADEVEVEVANDGRSKENGDGHGLVGMRERAALCGGDLTTGPRPGGGYTISARLPVTGSTR
jgi:signal transduction histidine kinase